MPTPPVSVIAGCGYLGSAVARRLAAAGRDVIALSRSPAGRDSVPDVRFVSGDLTAESGLTDAVRAVDGRLPVLIFCASSPRGAGAAGYRDIYLTGLRNLLRAFPEHRRLLFTGSTSVYAQCGGEWVTEESPAKPARETGRILREAESVVLAAGGTVVRLAGLYGPGRSVLLREFLDGRASIDVHPGPPATPDGRWINQIHRDDAASAIVHLLMSVPDPEGIWNVSDSTPMLQRELYAWLAHEFSREMPPGRPPGERKRGWSHKRVSNGKLRRSGWSPAYPSFPDAVHNDPAFLPSIVAQCGAQQSP